MKIDKEIALDGNLRLKQFGASELELQTYFRWMKDDQLRYETGSEEMSYEDVKAMQINWMKDEDSRFLH